MPKKREHLGATPVVDLGPAFEGYPGHLIAGVGLDGAIYAAASRSSEARTEERGFGIFPKSELDEPDDVLVVRSMGDRQDRLLVRGERLVVSFVQPLAGGILLAGARCHWRPEGPEQNARALDWSGTERARFVVGDGIQDLRVTPDGTIWVSYFDEGIFGNFGWNGPGPEPMGAAGLLAFSETGEPRFAYDPEAAGTDMICDAYALNVGAEGEVWLYFYTEFPIVRIANGSYRAWQHGIGGARALAVQGERVLLLGDYERPDLARVVELRKRKARVVRELRLVDEAGRALGAAPAWGAGADLYLLDERRVLVVRDW